MEYSDVSEKYPEFYYHDFAILETEDEFHVQYDFEIKGLSHFNPDFIISKPAEGKVYGNLRTVREAAFSLGLAELISYWKLTCSPIVIIECGFLSSEQTTWWKKLYFNGLADFFRANRIHPDPDAFMDLRSTGEQITGQIDQRRFRGNLIPVGGGQDSLVTLQVLSEMRDENYAFVLNHVMAAVHCAQAAGYHGRNLIIAERNLDSRMLEFNKAGFLNGHTPFSALCAFAASLTAAIYGIQNICHSNEASAGEPLTGESPAEYSRTFEFECDFKRYMDTYITPEIHYFSLLRPIGRLQITGLFSTLEQYHKVFRSCSEGKNEERWCGRCEKCLLSCIFLSAYLPDDRLFEIFGTDILNAPAMQEVFDQLCGTESGSPSENSGLKDEVNTAVSMSIRHHEHSGRPLPLLYQNYMKTSYYEYYRDKAVDWLQYDTENLVPEDYQKLLREWLGEMKQQ